MPVFMAHLELHLKPLTLLFHDLFHYLPGFFDILRPGECFPDRKIIRQFIRFVTKHALPSGRIINLPGFEVPFINPVFAGIHGQVKPFFALLQGLFRLLALLHLRSQPSVDNNQKPGTYGQHHNHKQGGKEGPVHPGKRLLGSGIVQKLIQSHVGVQKPQFLINPGDMPPSARIHMPDLHQVGKHHFLDGFRLVIQMIRMFFHAILCDQQIDDFRRMGHGIFPAPKGCIQKRLDLPGVFPDFRFRGKQAVTVKIHPTGPGRDHCRFNALLQQLPGFICHIRADRIGAPLDQIIEIIGLIETMESIQRHPFI